jgi:NDP-sugar pyrophosphorylase family protein
VYVSVNYRSDMVKEHLRSSDLSDVELLFIDEEERMGTAGALALLPQPPTGPLLVVNADVVTTTNFSDLFDYHRDHQCVVTVAAAELKVPVPYGVLNTHGPLLLGIEEKPVHRFLCSAGIYVLEPHILAFAEGSPMDMPELVQRVVDRGLPVAVFPLFEQWLDVGTEEDLAEARGRVDQAPEDRQS